MILAKFSWCMLILSFEDNLGEIEVKVEKSEHGIYFENVAYRIDTEF